MIKRNRHVYSAEVTAKGGLKRGPTIADLRDIAAPDIRDDRRQADRRRDSGERRLDRNLMGQDLELIPEFGALPDEREKR